MKLQELAKDLHVQTKDLVDATYEVFGRKINLNSDISLRAELKIRDFIKLKNKNKAAHRGSLVRRKKVVITSQTTKTSPIIQDASPNTSPDTRSEDPKNQKYYKNFLTTEIKNLSGLTKPQSEKDQSTSDKNKKEHQKTKNLDTKTGVKGKGGLKPNSENLDSKKKHFQNQKSSKKVDFKKLSEDTERKIYKKFEPLRKSVFKKKKKIHDFASRKKEIIFTSVMNISDFSKLIGKKIRDITAVAKQILDTDIDIDIITSEIAELVAEELKVKITIKKSVLETKLEVKEQGDLELRPPIVTIMGHVDHGKTSLLDCVRNSNVADKEAGQITQHIGAYLVNTPQGKITFLDTPGHEAFSSMRIRGSSITDIVILVIALDDGVKPQTIEAIRHAKLAKVPIIVALTKCDKPNTDAKKIIESLMQYELISEEYNGDTTMIEVSAKTKKGIDELLELILIQAESMQLQTISNGPAKGVIIESRIDKKRGNIVSLLVQSGSLKAGDHIFSEKFYAKIRSMSDENGKILKTATPSRPVEVMGFSNTPPAGSVFQVTTEKLAKMMAEKNLSDEKNKFTELDTSNLEEKLTAAKTKELNILLKADTYGSLEAIEQLVSKIKHEQVAPKIIFSSVGAINLSDINLAITTEALVIGFYVRPEKAAKELAESQGIEINIFDVIYGLIDKVRLEVSGMLEPIIKQELQGKAQVLNIFNIPKIGQIAGCKVLDGKIIKDSILKVIRTDNLVHEGKLQSLRHLKSNVEKIDQGEECGIMIQNYKNFQVNDTIECYVQTTQQLQL